MIFLQGTFTPSVHAHAGRTQKIGVGRLSAAPQLKVIWLWNINAEVSAFYGWRCWHWNEFYFIVLFFFGVENIVVTFFTEPFSSLVLSIPWQKSLPFPALLWCCQLGEIDIIAPCTSGLSVFLRWIYVQLFSGVEIFVVNFVTVHFSSLALKIQRQKSPPFLALRWC